MRREGYTLPDFVSISPSANCNLNCKGCYACSYKKDDIMSKGKMNDIIDQARQLGTYVLCITGGEPLMYPYLMEILEENRDMYFLIYTNGMLIDEKFCRKIAKLGNAAILLSIEGRKEETDYRRGKGCYEKVMNAAFVLKKKRIIFGYTLTVSRQNADVIADEDFFRYLVETGASIIWLSTYLPVGSKSDLSMIPLPEQRVKLQYIISRLRRKLPVLIIDFENDSRYVGGCTGAGRRFLHINNNGNIEVCNFTHFYQDNIYEKSLIEALDSDLFREIRKYQPFCDCTYTPCLLDCNADILESILKNVEYNQSYKDALTLFHDKEYIEFSKKYRAKIQELFNEKNVDILLEGL